MDFCFTTFAALFLLFAAASCAPAGLSLRDACAGVRSSSLELNHIARLVSVEARNGSRYLDNFSSPAWMEAKDMCDPESLKQTSVPCIENMLHVLTSYNSTVERVSGFQSCSKFASKVKPAMQKLHKDMSKCVNSRPGVIHQKLSSNDEIRPIEQYEEDLLCYYILDRLFSFSIFAARVFAVGDPAHHAEGSAQKSCRA